MTMSNNKKMKTSQDKEDFDRIKKYIQECPHVSREHPLIKAAIAAVEKEQQRIERDRKLQAKFSKQQHGTGVQAVDPAEEGLVVVEKTPARRSSPSNPDEEMDWQDVQEKEKEYIDETSSYLGRNLAKAAVDMISEYQQKVKSPVAAVAVALHAALRSNRLGFACTGIPEAETKVGFAPPVRELGLHQFLPTSWDSSSTNIVLRYRKNGTGALLLLVEQCDSEEVITVRFQQTSTREPAPQKISFARGEYVNLESFNAAAKVASLVSPTLHYKSLAVLMTQFCQAFDLGTMEEDENGTLRDSKAVQYVDNTVPRTIRSEFIPARPTPSLGDYSTPHLPGRVPATFGEAFPGFNPLRVGGDFSGDLAPAGIQDPHFLHDGGRMGGNLMGPNHPAFQGGGVPLGGRGSMQPRFDPIYPEGIDFPGGGQGMPRRGAGPNSRPRRSGEPNPDHLPPPNSFNDSMFS